MKQLCNHKISNVLSTKETAASAYQRARTMNNSSYTTPPRVVRNQGAHQSETVDLSWLKPTTRRRPEPSSLTFEPIDIKHGEGEKKPFAGVIRNVFTPEECADMITFTEGLGYEDALVNVGRGRQVFDPDYRKSQRCIVDSRAQAGEIWERIKPFVPREWTPPNSYSNSSPWEVTGLNPRLRYLKYKKGDFFAQHGDGAYRDTKNHQSYLTLQLYLNTEGDDFKGGATTFFSYDEKTWEAKSYSCHPEAGMVLLFEHPIQHEGSLLESGTKYNMRTDIMYRKEKSRGEEGSTD